MYLGTNYQNKNTDSYQLAKTKVGNLNNNHFYNYYVFLLVNE